MTEPDINQLCKVVSTTLTGSAALMLEGKIPEVCHIVTASAAISLLGMAAQNIVRERDGTFVAADDERITWLIQGWAAALQLRYPDYEAVGEAMTNVRENFMQGKRDGR